MGAKNPESIDIALTTVCNIKPPCVMCCKHTDSNAGYIGKNERHMSKEVIDKILPLIPSAKDMSLHGIGEPLAHPKIFEIAKKAHPDCFTWFASNGLLIDEKTAHQIIESRIKNIELSVDAGTPETYAKIRHADFYRLKKNLLALRRIRGSGSFPKIELNMCLMVANMHDAKAFVHLASEVADSCFFHHMNKGPQWVYDWFSYEEQHCENNTVEHDRFIDEAFNEADRLGVKVIMKGSKYLSRENKQDKQEETAKPFYCGFPFKKVHINTNGTVMVCCWMGGTIGDLNKQSFDEIWNSDKLNRIRDSINAGRIPDECAKGLPCPPKGKV
jgi:MoaA/NifB/PqqE/SkfB family radical SAM enzyme